MVGRCGDEKGIDTVEGRIDGPVKPLAAVGKLKREAHCQPLVPVRVLSTELATYSSALRLMRTNSAQTSCGNLPWATLRRADKHNSGPGPTALALLESSRHTDADERKQGWPGVLTNLRVCT